jgi:hypothetical protein
MLYPVIVAFRCTVALNESPKLSSEMLLTIVLYGFARGFTLGLLAETVGLRLLWYLRFTLVRSYDQSATLGFVAVSRQRFGVFFAFIVCTHPLCRLVTAGFIASGLTRIPFGVPTWDA